MSFYGVLNEDLYPEYKQRLNSINEDAALVGGLALIISLIGGLIGFTIHDNKEKKKQQKIENDNKEYSKELAEIAKQISENKQIMNQIIKEVSNISSSVKVNLKSDAKFIDFSNPKLINKSMKKKATDLNNKSKEISDSKYAKSKDESVYKLNFEIGTLNNEKLVKSITGKSFKQLFADYKELENYSYEELTDSENTTASDYIDKEIVRKIINYIGDICNRVDDSGEKIKENTKNSFTVHMYYPEDQNIFSPDPTSFITVTIDLKKLINLAKQNNTK